MHGRRSAASRVTLGSCLAPPFASGARWRPLRSPGPPDLCRKPRAPQCCGCHLHPWALSIRSPHRTRRTRAKRSAVCGSSIPSPRPIGSKLNLPPILLAHPDACQDMSHHYFYSNRLPGSTSIFACRRHQSLASKTPQKSTFCDKADTHRWQPVGLRALLPLQAHAPRDPRDSRPWPRFADFYASCDLCTIILFHNRDGLPAGFARRGSIVYDAPS